MKNILSVKASPGQNAAVNIKKKLKKCAQFYELYIFLIPALLYFIIFHYGPLYGLQIAFKNFIPTKGIMGSPWVGFHYFADFFVSPMFGTIMKNTVSISLLTLIYSFPLPILLALMMNEVINPGLKKTIQTITYAPHFISTVVLVGMINLFLSPKVGIVNHVINAMGMQSVNFMAESSCFIPIYIISHIWQHTGWNSIIYMAALAGIDSQLHEAAIIDGATKMQRIWYVNIPGLIPTIVILFILNSGQLMNVGFEKVFLMQNPMNMQSSDVISTYVYRMGIQSYQFSFSAAVGLFNSVINFIILIFVNYLSKRLNETSLW